MGLRKIENAKEARRCLSAAKASGLTNTEWARREGVDGRSLHAWGMNLGPGKRSQNRKKGGTRQSTSRSAPPRMVEVVPGVKQARVAGRPARYAVRCGELTIELDKDFEDETLRRLLRVVASC